MFGLSSLVRRINIQYVENVGKKKTEDEKVLHLLKVHMQYIRSAEYLVNSLIRWCRLAIMLERWSCHNVSGMHRFAAGGFQQTVSGKEILYNYQS